MNEQTIAEKIEAEEQQRDAWLENSLAEFARDISVGVEREIYLPSGDSDYAVHQRRTNERHVYADIGELCVRANRLGIVNTVTLNVTVTHVPERDLPGWDFYVYRVWLWA